MTLKRTFSHDLQYAHATITKYTLHKHSFVGQKAITNLHKTLPFLPLVKPQPSAVESKNQVENCGKCFFFQLRLAFDITETKLGKF